MAHRRRLALSLTAIGTACIVGCADREAGLTKAEYASKLNAMCRDFAAREEQIGEPRTMADVAERGDQIADAFDKAIGDKVRKLEAPEEIAAQAKRMRAIAEEQGDTLRRLAEAARQHDLARLRNLATRNAALNSEAGDSARELGADHCAGG